MKSALAATSVHVGTAQSSAGGGTITGTVKDSTGAVIPDVKVSITDVGRFRDGLAYQVFYMMTNSLRLAGNSFRDDRGIDATSYLPGTEGKPLGRNANVG